MVTSRLFSTEYLLYPSLPTTLQVPVQEHVSELGWVQPAVIVEYSAVEYHPKQSCSMTSNISPYSENLDSCLSSAIKVASLYPGCCSLKLNLKQWTTTDDFGL